MSESRPELQQAAREFVDAGFAGMQLRVRDDRGEWTGSAGVRALGEPGPPPTDGTFWVGSSTKTFVAALVLHLVADGLTGLDAPVAGHLPGLGLDGRITVRMLLRHTSGLASYTGDPGPDGVFVPGLPATGRAWVENRFHDYRPEELVRFALALPQRFEPGAGQSYSNTNYTLAVLLAESLTGRPWAEEMRRRILDPLGLRDTLVPGGSVDLPAPHAHGYCRYQDADGTWRVVDVSRQNSSLLTGAGDMVSTTRDLGTFFAALLGGRLLPAPLLAGMLEPHGPLGYGLGLFVQDLGTGAGTVVHHHGGAPGGYGALMIATPDGRTVLTAGLTMGDAPIDPAQVFPAALDRLVTAVFRTGRPRD
ncbi:serine hydrolase domain-containing protein [Kitasatospora sp. NPDC056327]|uniref:serine hydrolase domain-containing protein n=1 Tax=Kitasatospora sp. NPDC056327 TaxID=3345785 RepID=UPI0035E176BF